MERKLLRIYLQDHLAGSTGGRELARRARGANKGTPYGEPLAKLADDIEADRRSLESLMEDLGFGADRAKNIALWAAEKAGRLKLNGQLRGYSPLSRVLELEGLTMGIEGKASLWRNLRGTPVAERLRDIDLDELLARAERQQASVEPHRVEAARRAFL
jgi:hypothetical protein